MRIVAAMAGKVVTKKVSGTFFCYITLTVRCFAESMEA